MKYLFGNLFVLLVVLALSKEALSFTPASRTAFRPATSLQMGLFDGMFGAKKPKPDNKKDVDVFAGRGARITVREDEDAAMWVEEPKDKKGKKKGGK